MKNAMKSPRCTCGSNTPGVHGAGCPRQAVTLQWIDIRGLAAASGGGR